MPADGRVSRSEYLLIRGLRYHVRRWGDAAAPKLVLLHGWQDVSASFQFMVEPLLTKYQVIAPDWRGFGASGWAPGGYWFADYVGDLDALMDHYALHEPVLLAGHSMGAQVAVLYAGLRPERVSRLIGLDGPGVREDAPDFAPARYLNWLNSLASPLARRAYASFEEYAKRIQRLHPRLTPERALFIAHCWCRQAERGRVVPRADPKHRIPFPTGYHFSDAAAIWQRVVAPTLFVDARESEILTRFTPEELAQRRSLIRDHRIAVIEDCGHMLHVDQPEAVAAALLDFLEAA